MYKCIKQFSLDLLDDDGFPLSEDEQLNIAEGSIWYFPEDKDYRIIGADIRLENDDLQWIEITNEDFKEHFELIK